MTPTRWAAVLCMLACAASAQRLDRLQRRLDRRDRLGGGTDLALLSMALTGDCEGTTPSGLTFSRTSTATCTLADGTLVTLAAGQPRLEAQGLLVEGTATNLLLRSEEVDNAAWTKGTTPATPVVTPNAGTAPDGTLTADGVTFAQSPAIESVAFQSASTTATPYVFSVYVKGNGQSGTIDVGAAVASTYAQTACSYTASGWSRCAHSFTGVAGNSTPYIGCETQGGVTNHCTASPSVLVWGAQLEAGPVATSYIPTVGTQVTRQPSVPSRAWPLAGQSPASWSVTVRGSPVGGSWATGAVHRTLWHVGDGAYGAANTATLYVNTNGSRLWFDVYDSAGALRQFQASLDIAPGPHVVTAAVSSGTPSVSVDGTPLAGAVTGTGTGVLGTHPNTLWLGRMGTQDRQFNGHLSSLCVSGPAGGCP